MWRTKQIMHFLGHIALLAMLPHFLGLPVPVISVILLCYGIHYLKFYLNRSTSLEYKNATQKFISYGNAEKQIAKICNSLTKNTKINSFNLDRQFSPQINAGAKMNGNTIIVTTALLNRIKEASKYLVATLAHEITHLDVPPFDSWLLWLNLVCEKLILKCAMVYFAISLMQSIGMFAPTLSFTMPFVLEFCNRMPFYLFNQHEKSTAFERSYPVFTEPSLYALVFAFYLRSTISSLINLSSILFSPPTIQRTLIAFSSLILSKYFALAVKRGEEFRADIGSVYLTRSPDQAQALIGLEKMNESALYFQREMSWTKELSNKICDNKFSYIPEIIIDGVRNKLCTFLFNHTDHPSTSERIAVIEQTYNNDKTLRYPRRIRTEATR